MSPHASWELGVGDAITAGRHVIRRLGGGRRTEVYLATDDRLLTPVVVKIARPDRIGDADRGALRREGELLAELRHPMFPRLVEADVEADRPVLVLEHLEGPRLSTLLRRHGRLGLEQVVPLAVQLASGLHYLHGEGLVHLDVKPGNVVMSAPPRLIDLSVARSVDEAARLTVPVGTADYLAPEQRDPGAVPIGPPADVWGLALTVREAATAEHLAGPVIRGRLPYPTADLPDVLLQLIDRCLAPDPADRPRAAEVADGLEPLVAALPVRPVLSRLRPSFRRR